MARCGYCGQTEIEYAEPVGNNPRMLKPHKKPKGPRDASASKCEGFEESYRGHLRSPRLD